MLAAAEFNRITQQRGLAWRATSRGTNPDAVVAPAIVAALESDGLRAQGNPTLVTASDVSSAAYTVTMGAAMPNSIAVGNIRDWNVPSTSADLDAARRDIRERVEKLLDEIAHHQVRRFVTNHSKKECGSK